MTTDFTWYLRNLLLAKSSDNMEDVLDVSTENLAQLKEEAQMIENDALMRYIRIFSDLSNQLKYATQKRVLLEVALIRVCVPQMETRQDTLLERIRALEEKVEKGLVVPAPFRGTLMAWPRHRECGTGTGPGFKRDPSGTSGGCEGSGEKFPYDRK